MKKIFLSSLVILSLPSLPCFSVEQVRVAALNGGVDIKASKRTDWLPAMAGAVVPEGALVRTSPRGRALLEFPNGSRIWLRESSTVELEQNRNLAARLALYFGFIKVDAPRVKNSERFELRTQTAVCGVRDAGLIMGINEDGKFKMSVLYGEVQLDYTVPPASGEKTLFIPQGHTLAIPDRGSGGSLSLLSPGDESLGVEDWSPGMTESERKAALEEREKKKSVMALFARDCRGTGRMLQGLAAGMREDDIEAGRTLTDINGNLVRVDQRLLRPDDRTLQFVNLVKRQEYKYSPRRFGGAYPDSPRLDSLLVSLEFNMALPQNLTDWPSFFKGRGDLLHPDQAVFVMANRSDRNDIFLVSARAFYDQPSGELKIEKEAGSLVLYMGRLNTPGDPAANLNGLARILGGGITPDFSSSAGSVTGFPGMSWALLEPPVPGGRAILSESGSSAQRLFSYEAQPYCIGGDCAAAASRVWFAQENFALDNLGNIKTVSDVAGFSSGAASLFRDSALQVAAYVKEDDPSQPPGGFSRVSSADWSGSGGKNLDVVIIPDAGAAIIRNMLAAAQDVKFGR